MDNVVRAIAATTVAKSSSAPASAGRAAATEAAISAVIAAGTSCGVATMPRNELVSAISPAITAAVKSPRLIPFGATGARSPEKIRTANEMATITTTTPTTSPASRPVSQVVGFKAALPVAPYCG